MKKLYLILISMSVSFTLSAQAPHSMPQHTPEEIASKQTEMLCRELNIKDSVQRQAIYAVHLRLCQQNPANFSRQQHIDSMQELFNALKEVLTPEQYQQFMNRPMNPEPRHPHHDWGNMPPPPPNGAGGYMPPPPPRYPQ